MIALTNGKLEQLLVCHPTTSTILEGRWQGVLHAVLERVEVSKENGQIARLVHCAWFRLFFRDLTELVDAERAWRGPDTRSVPRLVSVIG